MASGGETQRKASTLEIVGAWLHVWVPPRDVDVPPVPWRKLAIGTAIGAIVLAGALALLVPRIDEGKSERAARAAAQARQARIANRNRILHVQRPRHAEDAALAGSTGAAARTQLLHSVEASILADAKARAAAGELRPVSGPSTCRLTRGTPTGGPLGSFDCFTVTSTIKATTRNAPGAIGYPFRAIVDFRHAAYTWCKVEQFPGEMLIPDPSAVVQLPAACRLPT